VTVKPAGFTLLEVIVAMTILGLGFSALFAGMSQSARGITKLEGAQRRLMFTRNLMAELDLVQLKPGDACSGVFPDGTRWRLEVQPYIQPTPQLLLGLVRVELRLEWQTPSALQRKTIETYRLAKFSSIPAAALEDQIRALQ
jgi:prepilin-type N-terminal cleavage/methylation domain-containing protein